MIAFSKAVEVAATKVFEGIHHTQRAGRGVEFESASSFTPGEEARFIDWKRYAATDRLYINRYQREEKSGWKIWLDGSSSMNYQNKTYWARLWAGSLIYLAKTWGDSWSLAPAFSHSVDEAFQFLASTQPSQEVELDALESAASISDRLILISDFFFDPKLLAKKIERLLDLYHSVHLIQILSPKELNFDFSEVTEFMDLESSSKLILDSKVVKSAYLNAFNALTQQLKALVSDRVSFMIFSSEGESLEQQLTEFFESL